MGVLGILAVSLTRFDGAKFVSYPEQSDEPLPSANLSALISSPDGGLWIGFGCSPVEPCRLLRRHEKQWRLARAASQHCAALRSLGHTNRQGFAFGILF